MKRGDGHQGESKKNGRRKGSSFEESTADYLLQGKRGVKGYEGWESKVR